MYTSEQELNMMNRIPKHVHQLGFTLKFCQTLSTVVQQECTTTDNKLQGDKLSLDIFNISLHKIENSRI
jgi:hypothetical protein